MQEVFCLLPDLFGKGGGEREIDSESNNKSYLYLINEVYIHMKCTCTDQTNTKSPKDTNKGIISTTKSTLRRMRLLQYISTVFPVQHPNATKSKRYPAGLL